MPPTTLLFRDDAYRRECDARVTEVLPEGVVLDATVFYPQGGGQPGDTGDLMLGGVAVPVADTRFSPDRSGVLHVLDPGIPRPALGDRVVARLAWAPRHGRMRIHTALHLLSVALPFPVTGGAIGEAEGRLDFDAPEGGLDREAIEATLDGFVRRDAAVTQSWITDEELDADPGLVKTLTVKPPRGTGRVRLVAIEGIDLQPCGGTHVARTGEIGPLVVTGIEKKGRRNRRVRIALAEAAGRMGAR